MQLEADAGAERVAQVRKLLRLIALAGSTVLSIILLGQIGVLVYTYIETYYLMPPPPFPVWGYHRFPIYAVVRDLRDVGVIVFALTCCLILFVRFGSSEK